MKATSLLARASSAVARFGSHTSSGSRCDARLVLIIAVAYNQVIELFPTGGGYKVASKLIDPYPASLCGGSGRRLYADWCGAQRQRITRRIPTRHVSDSRGHDR